MDAATVREARPEDATAISRLHVEAWRWAYAEIMPPGHLASLDPKPRQAMWASRLATAEGRARVAVAHVGEELAGFVSWGRYRPDGHGDGTDLGDAVGEVQAIYLGRRHQGRGIGRALLARAVDGLTAAGHGEAKLWVLEDNTLARRFYERQGWATDGARAVEDFAGRPLVELRYGRPLR